MGKKKQEKKIKISISIHKSIHDEIKRRLESSGMKLSPLIENLLVGWAWTNDETARKIKELEKMGKDITPKDVDRDSEKFKLFRKKLEGL